MSTSINSLGIKHLTVVPTNFDPTAAEHASVAADSDDSTEQ